MVLLDVRPTGDQEVTGSIPAGSGNILSWRLIKPYIYRFSAVILSLREGHLSFSGERMCTKVNRLED